MRASGRQHDDSSFRIVIDVLHNCGQVCPEGCAHAVALFGTVQHDVCDAVFDADVETFPGHCVFRTEDKLNQVR